VNSKELNCGRSEKPPMLKPEAGGTRTEKDSGRGSLEISGCEKTCENTISGMENDPKSGPLVGPPILKPEARGTFTENDPGRGS
jgi:hypothetical protein